MLVGMTGCRMTERHRHTGTASTIQQFIFRNIINIASVKKIFFLDHLYFEARIPLSLKYNVFEELLKMATLNSHG